MYATKLRSFPKKDKVTGDRLFAKDGSPRTQFIYEVHGTPAEIEQYLEQIVKNSGKTPETFTDEVTGNVVYFTEYALPFDSTPLIITSKGNIVPDVSDVYTAVSLHKQFGAIGDMIATKMLAKHFNTKVPETVEIPEDVD